MRDTEGVGGFARFGLCVLMGEHFTLFVLHGVNNIARKCAKGLPFR